MIYYDMYGNPYNSNAVAGTNFINPNQQQMMNFQQPINQFDNRFMWIQGKEAAKAYPVAPDKTVFFLDDKDAYAYLKKTDREGKTVEFKTYQLVEEKEPEPVVQQADSNAVSREEFNTFSKNIDTSLNELKEMILSAHKFNKPNPQKRQVRDDG